MSGNSLRMSYAHIAYCIRTSPSRWFLRRKQAWGIWQMAQMGVAHNGGCGVVYCTLVDCDCKIIRATMTIKLNPRWSFSASEILIRYWSPVWSVGGLITIKGHLGCVPPALRCGVSLMIYLINNRLYQMAIVLLPIEWVHLWFEKLSEIAPIM